MYNLRILTVICLMLAGMSSEARAQDNILFLHPYALPDVINTPADETHLVFDRDSSNLYFVRAIQNANKLQKNLWTAHLDDNKDWVRVKDLKGFNKSGKDEYIGLNNDGSTIYLLHAHTRSNVKRHKKKKKVRIETANDWSPSTEVLEIKDFSLEGRYTFHINTTENVLLLSENRKDALGQEDLYVSLRSSDGTWEKPFSLGNVINTDGSEISPFLSNNGDTLYFSSDGHPGFGGADIFYSIRKDDTWKNWTEPRNLGNIINTEYADAYFIRSDKDCYFSSNRSGNYQIYHTMVYDAPPIAFNIDTKSDVSRLKGSDGSITLMNLEPNFTYEKLVFFHDHDSTVLKDVTTNSAGKVRITGLISGSYHNFEAHFDGHKAICMDDVLIREPGSGVTQRGNIPKNIQKLIYFDMNSSYLNKESIEVLDELIGKIKSLKKYDVTIESHADTSADDQYNIWLSERRTQRVKSYLISKGISPFLIHTQAMGENEPLIDCENCDDGDHMKNRRTVIRVVY